jgi:hypothetical protein
VQINKDARKLAPVICDDKLTAFGAQLIGQRDVRSSLIGFAPKALRLSNSIEPTPFGLRSARSAGTVNCMRNFRPQPMAAHLAARYAGELKKRRSTERCILIKKEANAK